MKKYLPTIIFVVAVLGLLVFAIFSASNSKNDSSNATTSVKANDQDAALLNQGPSKGAENAKVTLVEFGDFQCPVCRNFEISILQKEIFPAYGDKIKFVWKQFPLNPQPHKNAFTSAVASEAANDQGKFWQMHDILFDKQTEWSELDDPAAKFAEYAGQIGLDVEKFKSDYASKKYDDKINQDKNLGQKLQVQGTPTFFVNGVQVATDGGPDAIKKALDEALKQ
ncbi:DsbA family protein [bacterium]|nr:DsbA family protein [bacterium]